MCINSFVFKKHNLQIMFYTLSLSSFQKLADNVFNTCSTHKKDPVLLYECMSKNKPIRVTALEGCTPLK